MTDVQAHILKSLLQELQTATKPVVKPLRAGKDFRVLAIGFNTGAVLAEHTTTRPTRLFVIKGSVVYREGDKSHLLNVYEDYEIPVNVRHSVEATADSLCLLTQGETT